MGRGQSDEAALDQGIERRGVALLAGGDRREHAVERLAGDRPALQQRSLLRRKGRDLVTHGGQHALGQLALAHTRELAQEQRVAGRLAGGLLPSPVASRQRASESSRPSRPGRGAGTRDARRGE